ncbi:MAG TPA: acetoin utilization protein AcuC [Ktedonobacteraceae bacterium]|nr:acetoin utilization protein AcuC [Ktedonobacteraceae bacterium]
MPAKSLDGGARFIFDPEELVYDFSGDRSFQKPRIDATLDLLKSSGLWRPDDPLQNLPLRPATLQELALIHRPDYIEAIEELSIPPEQVVDESRRLELKHLALKYGFDTGDTPALPHMHEALSKIVGGTLVGLSAVLGLPEGGDFPEGVKRPLHVFHPTGGLHHAWAARASGFSVYNDIAVAIAHAIRASEAKILYLDFDGHHGDGVQSAFFDEPRVMTVSFHETGRTLFPGTGDPLDLGKGLGRGYSVNVPLEPFTEDASYREALQTVLVPLALSFAPDVIISVHGCDTHVWDPLTHLSLTLDSMQAQIKLTHELAHTYCEGRWVALGGGGYDLFRVVPRAWSMLWAEVSGQDLPEALPTAWIEHWQPYWERVKADLVAALLMMGKPPHSTAFPTIFQDRAEDFLPQPRQKEISRINRDTLALVRQLVVPPPVRQAFPPLQRRLPSSSASNLLRPRGGEIPSQQRVLTTAQGKLLMRNFCPPSLVERLRPERDLRAFTRVAEREHQLLLSIARSPDCTLTLAHTPEGEIVGEVTLAPGEGWWEGLENLYEVTIEVSPNWRSQRIAGRMLAFSLELEYLEQMIVLAMGLSWHWDMEGLGITTRRYSKLISKLFSSQGFVEYQTSEPNISQVPGNILMVRIGKQVDPQIRDRFLNHLSTDAPKT